MRTLGEARALYIYKTALQSIAQLGCMQSKDEEEFFCKHDGSAHSIYCPAGIALKALQEAAKCAP